MLSRSRSLPVTLLAIVAAAICGVYAAFAQSIPPGTAPAREPSPKRAAIRFLTDGDFPPFNFFDEEGALTGFNVDLARAICAEAQATCDVQPRPWQDLLPALSRGEADAVIAGHAITAEALARADFSDRYLPVAARLASSRSAPVQPTPQGLDGKRIGVARGTAHEAYARTFFRDSRVETFATADAARDALMTGKLDAIFDDSVSLMFWVAGTNSRACCDLVGDAFIEPRYFGDGMAVAVAKGDLELVRVINAALKAMRDNGRLEELAQRYFPSRLH